MANWALPTLSDTWADYTAFLKNRDVDLALGLDPATTTVTSPPTNAIRWNSANKFWELFNGSTWAALANPYIINIQGTVNKVTLTQPATSATITVTDGKTFAATNTITLGGVDGKTLNVSKNLTLDGTDGTTITFQGTDTYIGRVTADQGANRVKNKDLEAGTTAIVDASDTTKKIKFSASGNTAAKVLTLAGAVTLDRTLTFPDATDTLVGRDTADALTGKTYNGLTITTTTGTITLTAAKTLTVQNSLTFSGTDGKSLVLTGGLTINQDWTVAPGGAGVTATFQGTGTYVHRTSTDTLTNKTHTNADNTDQTLAQAATINWDTSLGAIATITLNQAGHTMAAPTNLKKGTYILHVLQDGTGNRTITTWNSVFKFPSATAPTLSTGAGKRDILCFICDGTNLYGPPAPWLDVR